MKLASKLNLSKREALLLLAAILLAFSLAGWRYLIAPLLQNALELRLEREALLQEQKLLQEQLQRRGDLSAAARQWQGRAAELHRSLPAPEQLPEVLAKLEELLQQSPVSVHVLQAAEPETEENYAALPLQLRVSGEPAALLDLLEQLEQFESLLLVDQLGWSRESETGASLELSFRLILHPSSQPAGSYPAEEGQKKDLAD